MNAMYVSLVVKNISLKSELFRGKKRPYIHIWQIKYVYASKILIIK